MKAKNNERRKKYKDDVKENAIDYVVDKAVGYDDDEKNSKDKSVYDAAVRGVRAEEHIRKGKGASKYKDAAKDVMKFVSDEAKRADKDKKKRQKK